VKEIVLRVLVGGSLVSAFALLGEMLKPKSFAGLLGAAPSIALATLGLTILSEGKHYASIEARSMIFGAVGFFFYAAFVTRVLIHRRMQVLSASVLAFVVWFGCSFFLWYTMVR
jgi:hypothetical protein